MNADRKPIDQDARDRIQRDLATSYAVEAGAGTGKTAVLTGRIVEAVRTGYARLPQIVAITFTERAASELKVRLRTALEDALADSSGEEAERLAEALHALDAAHASTIHAFAAEILRERPVEAGVDPGFEIADELDASLLFDKAWSGWLARQLAEEGGPLRAAFLAGLRTDDLREFARRLLDHPGLEPAGEDLDLAQPAAEAAAAFVASARELETWMRAHCPNADCSCATRAATAARVALNLDGADADELLARLPSIPPLGLSRPQRACKEHKEACKARLNELEELVADLRGPAGHMLVRQLAGLLGGMLDRYAEAKQDRGVLDFVDLLRKARDLLRDDKDVRAYFQRRFKMILVDECQDTDPLQTEIVLFLAEKGASAADWRKVTLVPGKLLFVGDPKQSIYRFRRADIEAYEEAKQVVSRSGKLETIEENFRSSASCVAWVNAVFGELIERPDDGAYQPDYVPLHAWRRDDEPAAIMLKPPEGTSFDSIGEARAAEAAAIARQVKQMVESAETVLDKPTGAMRPAAYGDVALLLRTRTALGTYEAALSESGVPFRTVSGKDFFAKQEVAELRLVLAAADRPYDALAVVAALRTSILGVSDDELASASAAEGGFNYLARDTAGGSYADRALGRLAAWHRERNTSSISRLVQSVLAETKALALFYLKPNGEQRAANLTKVIDAARSYEVKAAATFGGFVRWLDERTKAAEEAESPLAAEGDGFVKLMTVHQAKGLEFPVVVLPDLCGGLRRGIQFVVGRGGRAFDAQIGARDRGVRTLGFGDAKDREQRVQEAEERRVLYVAATRARDRLIVPHFPKKGKPAAYLSYLTGLSDDAAAAAGCAQREVVETPESVTPSEPKAFRADLSRTPPKACEKLCKDRDKWMADRKELIEKSSAGKRLRTASALGGDDYQDFGSAAGESETGKAVGKAVHAVLEQADLKTAGGLAALAASAAEQQAIPEHAPLVEELVRNALQTDLVMRAANARKLYREVPFAVKLAEHAQNYRLQVGAYALAVKEVFGAAPRSASLLFLRTGKAVPVEVDDALLEAVTEKL